MAPVSGLLHDDGVIIDPWESRNGKAEHMTTTDTTIKKIDSTHSPRGAMGQIYLASGVSLAMRMWRNEEPADLGTMHSRSYETVGYVISGRAELHSEGQMVTLAAGDSWVVPKGAKHAYKVLEEFTAVEATHPPAQVNERDAA
jgi:quercetin dioxygenase-like cupin family protein